MGSVAISVSTVYAFDMPKKIVIYLQGYSNSPIKVDADSIMREGIDLLIRKNNVEIGRFKQEAVQGWYIVDDE